MKNPFTIIINTFNEETNIVNCIKSAKLLSQSIIVIDMQSVDETVSLAEENGAKVFSYPRFGYVEPARKFGIEKAETPWVLILDADERITKELASEINEILRFDQNDKITHYRIPRKNIFGKLKWLKYGGWWPDYQIRLIKKDAFVDWPKEIHSTPAIKGDCGYLKNSLVHFFHGNFKSMVKKTIIFEEVESNLLFEAGKQVSTSTFFRKFLGELYRRMIRDLGFLDGTFGIIEAINQAFSKTVTYIFLYEKQKYRQSRSL